MTREEILWLLREHDAEVRSVSVRWLIAEIDRLEAVARAADAYTSCIAEFSETAAGDLSNCCSEHYQYLESAVLAWKETKA